MIMLNNGTMAQMHPQDVIFLSKKEHDFRCVQSWSVPREDVETNRTPGYILATHANHLEKVFSNIVLTYFLQNPGCQYFM